MADFDFIKVVRDKIDSGSGILWINAHGDEERAEVLLQKAAEGTDLPNGMKSQSTKDKEFVTWDVVNGASWERGAAATSDPMEAICKIPSLTKTVFVYRDLHLLLNAQQNYGLRRALLTLCKSGGINNDKQANVVVIVADSPTPHADIKDFCDVVELPLPDETYMESEVLPQIWSSWERAIREFSEKSGKNVVISELDPELKEKIVQSLLGITSAEATRILAYACSQAGGFNSRILEIIADEKIKVFRKVPGLTFVPHSKIIGEDEIGGYSNFVAFLNKRARSYTKHAQEIGIERPRGVVLLGIPGTGKTIAGKAAARVLGLDLVVIDMTAMLDSYVGSSEKRQREALAVVSALPNCLALVDELDKVFAGAHQNTSDSGVSSHLLSGFLSWLSERDMADACSNRVFVAVTANRIDNLPPELLRAGRFDRIFSVDLPSVIEREEILAIHLRKRGVDPALYDLECVAAEACTGEFSGAEIEELVVTARHDAYDRTMAAWETNGKKDPPPNTEDVRPTIDDLLIAAKGITPLARLDSESIRAVRDFCRTRTVSVSSFPQTAREVKSRNMSSRQK